MGCFPNQTVLPLWEDNWKIFLDFGKSRFFCAPTLKCNDVVPDKIFTNYRPNSRNSCKNLETKVTPDEFKVQFLELKRKNLVLMEMKYHLTKIDLYIVSSCGWLSSGSWVVKESEGWRDGVGFHLALCKFPLQDTLRILSQRVASFSPSNQFKL